MLLQLYPVGAIRSSGKATRAGHLLAGPRRTSCGQTSTARARSRPASAACRGCRREASRNRRSSPCRAHARAHPAT